VPADYADQRSYRSSLCRPTPISCWAIIAACRMTAATLARSSRSSSTARRFLGIGRWTRWVACGSCWSRLKWKTLRFNFSSRRLLGRLLLLLESLKSTPRRINAGYPCAGRRQSLPRQRLRSQRRMLRGSSFILPSPAIRKSLPILPTPARSSFSPILKSATTAPTPKTTKRPVLISKA